VAPVGATPGGSSPGELVFDAPPGEPPAGGSGVRRPPRRRVAAAAGVGLGLLALLVTWLAASALRAPRPDAPAATRPGAPPPAPPPDPLVHLLPDDTAAVVHVNFHSLAEAPLAVEYAEPLLRPFTEESPADPLAKTARYLGLNPWADVGEVRAAVADEPDRGLVILKGSFSEARFQARGERRPGLALVGRPGERGGHRYYESDTRPGPPQDVLALAAPGLLLMARDPGRLLEGLDKAAGRRAPEWRHWALPEWLKRLDLGKHVSFAGRGSPLLQWGRVRGLAPEFRQALARSSVHGYVDFAGKVEAEFQLQAEDAEQAAALEGGLEEAGKLVLEATLTAGGRNDLKALRKAVLYKSLRRDGTRVVWKTWLTEDMIRRPYAPPKPR
jgi:hypothetical protein